MLGFHICALIWLIYLLLPEKQDDGNLPKPDEMDQWNEELGKIVAAKLADWK
jgi:hypothetical protein